MAFTEGDQGDGHYLVNGIIGLGGLVGTVIAVVSLFTTNPNPVWAALAASGWITALLLYRTYRTISRRAAALRVDLNEQRESNRDLQEQLQTAQNSINTLIKMLPALTATPRQ